VVLYSLLWNPGEWIIKMHRTLEMTMYVVQNFFFSRLNLGTIGAGWSTSPQALFDIISIFSFTYKHNTNINTTYVIHVLSKLYEYPYPLFL